MTELIDEFRRLREQLAAVTQERDAYKERAKWKHVHDDSLEIEMQRQLTTAQQAFKDVRKDMDTLKQQTIEVVRAERQAVWEEVTTRLRVRLNRVEEDGELPVIGHELEAWIRWCIRQAKKEAQP